MATIAQSNFQEHLKWFQKEVESTGTATSIPRNLVFAGLEYSFPQSPALLQPMISVGSFSMGELAKFVDGKPRNMNFPVPTFQPLPPPQPREKLENNSANNSRLLPQSTSSHLATHSSISSKPNKVTPSIDQFPESLLEEMDLDKILEEAEAAAMTKTKVTENKQLKTMSDMLGVPSAGYKSHTMVLSKDQSSKMPLSSVSNPLNITASRVVRQCHCNIECEISTITNSSMSKRSFLCRRMACSFLEWIEDEGSSKTSHNTENHFTTPYVQSSHIVAGNAWTNGDSRSFTVDQQYPSEYQEGANNASFNGSSNYNNNNNNNYSTALTEVPINNGVQAFDNYQQSTSSYNNNYNYNSFSSAKLTTDIKSIRNPRVEVQKRFGHREFRTGQWDCIEAALQGRDVFCLMPTGGGKSMVYQLPAWCCLGISVVFSPLISLIQDQVDALNAMGIRAVCLSQSATGQDYESSEGRMLLQELRSYHNNSTKTFANLSPSEQARIQKEDEQRIKMLYVTPEKFSRSPAIRSLLQQLMHHQLLSRFVLDEAHCLSQWGHDFRPDYLRLAEIRQLCPSVPIMALTATANQSVVQDIVKILQMEQPFVHTQSFNRPNLTYKVLQKKGEKSTLEEIANYIVSHIQWTGIIYCLSRRDCEVLVDDLTNLKPQLRGKISFYHADLNQHEKESRQRLWFKGDIRVLCATIAFGMGINKPDVRYVLHLHMPKSLTNYYQESGRAGRDGLAAECILYYSYKDKSRVLSMLDKSQASFDGQQRQLTSLLKCLDFCLDEVTCRRQLILSYFGETFDSTLCKNTCDTCQAMSVLRQNFTINGLPMSRLIETHDITHIGTLAVHLVMTTSTQNENNAPGGRYNNSYNNNRNKLPKLTAAKLAKLLSGSKGKEVNQYISSLNSLKENLQQQFRDQDIHNIHTQYGKEAMEVICHRLLIDGFLKEEHIVNNVQGNYGADYLILGSRARELLENHNNTRVYVKFRGQLPTNGYGPNTGITNSVAAKSNKKNSSKSSHSNIVQSNGQLGSAYAQHHMDEILLDKDDDVDPLEEDDFGPIETNAKLLYSATVDITSDSIQPSTVYTNNYPASDAGVPSKKRKSPNEPNAYSYLDEITDDEMNHFAQANKGNKSKPAVESKIKSVSDDEMDSENESYTNDDFNESEDSAENLGAYQLHKKPRTADSTDTRIIKSAKKANRVASLAADDVVDLLNDSQAEDVTLDAAHVTAQGQRYRAAQKAKLQQMRLERQQLRQQQKQQRQQQQQSVPTTIKKSGSSYVDVSDVKRDDNHGYMNSSILDGEVPASAGVEEDMDLSANSSLNKSTLSAPVFQTKRTLDFDSAANDERGFDDSNSDDEEASFPTSYSASKRQPQQTNKPKQIRTFLGDFEAASDFGEDGEDDDENDDIANIALHAFPSRGRKHGDNTHQLSLSKKSALSLFTQREKLPFKPPYLSQKERAKQAQREAELAESKRLEEIGENGLTGRQQDALRAWLQAYRRRWANYWHHLSDASLEHIVCQCVPQTISDVADVPGIGESRAIRDGPELLATLASFVFAQLPDTEVARLCALFPNLTTRVPPDGVNEDIIWRDPMSDAAQAKMSGGSSAGVTMGRPSLNGSSSATANAHSSSAATFLQSGLNRDSLIQRQTVQLATMDTDYATMDLDEMVDDDFAV